MTPRLPHSSSQKRIPHSTAHRGDPSFFRGCCPAPPERRGRRPRSRCGAWSSHGAARDGRHANRGNRHRVTPHGPGRGCGFAVPQIAFTDRASSFRSPLETDCIGVKALVACTRGRLHLAEKVVVSTDHVPLKGVGRLTSFRHSRTSTAISTACPPALGRLRARARGEAVEIAPCQLSEPVQTRSFGHYPKTRNCLTGRSRVREVLERHRLWTTRDIDKYEASENRSFTWEFFTMNIDNGSDYNLLLVNALLIHMQERNIEFRNL